MLPQNCLIGSKVNKECLVQNAEYTVIGTVVKSELGNSNSQNYSATMKIHCVLASFSQNIHGGAGIIGKEFIVNNWGLPHKGCPPGSGSEAVLNKPMIYFLSGATNPLTAFDVQDPCVGGIELVDLVYVSNALKNNPENNVTSCGAGYSVQMPPPDDSKDVQDTNSSSYQHAFYYFVFILFI